MTVARYLSPKEIASRLGLSLRTVYRLLQDLPRVKIGGSIRVAEGDLAAFIKRNTVAAKRNETSRRPASIAPLDLADPRLPSWVRPLKPRNRRAP